MATQVLDVQLIESDTALFAGNQWLNDNAINFYLQYLTQTTAPNDMLLMDPAVVSCLLFQCEDENEYKELAEGLDLKRKQTCLIPVTNNDTLSGESSHWSLLVFCNKKFKHFDSSSGLNKIAARRVAKNFELLLQAAGRRDENELSDQVEDVQDAPQQQNSYDCGMYVLVIADFLCRQHAGKMGMISLGDYATPQRVSELRRQILNLIKRLQARNE